MKRVLRAWLPKAGLRNLESLETWDLKKNAVFLGSDIVNYHNLHGEYFSYLGLPALTAQRPGVLTLHDMWALTGHCIYSYDCGRWESGCGSCPYPQTYPEISRDATRFELRLKRRSFSRSRLSVVAVSRWMEQQARRSILNQHPIHTIPYGLDLEIFKPLDPKQCRAFLGLPSDALLILFAAADIRDKRKGIDLFADAIRALPASLKQGCALVVMGRHDTELLGSIGITAHCLGFIQDDRLKAQVFSAADIFAFPTRADNLPLVLQESMACGTPMISFNVGGVSELVRDGITGYLAEAENVSQFREALERLVSARAIRSRMAQACREIAREEYSLELQASRYEALFFERIDRAGPLPGQRSVAGLDSAH